MSAITYNCLKLISEPAIVYSDILSIVTTIKYNYYKKYLRTVKHLILKSIYKNNHIYNQWILFELFLHIVDLQ